MGELRNWILLKPASLKSFESLYKPTFSLLNLNLYPVSIVKLPSTLVLPPNVVLPSTLKLFESTFPSILKVPLITASPVYGNPSPVAILVNPLPSPTNPPTNVDALI